VIAACVESPPADALLGASALMRAPRRSRAAPLGAHR